MKEENRKMRSIDPNIVSSSFRITITFVIIKIVGFDFQLLPGGYGAAPERSLPIDEWHAYEPG